MKELTLRISRFDPKKDTAPHFENYTVNVHDGARVLHALHAVHDDCDPTLTYRYCCGTGQCGSCAVRVNGQPVLACMEEALEGITVEPLEIPVIKDLAVDLLPYINELPIICPVSTEAATMPAKDIVETMKPLRSCIGCMACVSVCPALSVSDFKGPTSMRQEMRLSLDPRDKKDRTAEAVNGGLFRCTSCQACWKVCPKEIQIPGKAIEKLREVAHFKGHTLPRHAEVAALIRETGRSVTWTEPSLLELTAEVMEPYGPVKKTVGFFVGCMYNLRLPKTALDAVEVLRRNGFRVVIPRDQICCGSPLIRTGQTEYVDTLKARNIAAFTALGIDTVVTMCAGCGSTLKHDYETPFKVIDFSELLAETGFGSPAHLGLNVTYHDPCHLARGQGVTEQPRTILRSLADITEMPSICCGSGGGVRSGFPDEAAALGQRRGDEIKKTGAEMVVTCCPFCEFHIAGHTDKPVRHLATLLLKGYREQEKSGT
ncbi:MAG: succinate dehydrogenase/fumarate reductase iron-sulfur subunit [Methanoregulaceae archaeon]|nr:succinate dehydrogenase/fumarate reductase iron-sulfur subunit [Methanoregulaceae archaeon]